jgi:hypothetical protein
MDERGEEQQRVGDVLRLVGEVLADEGIVEAEPVGEDDGLAVLLQRFGVIPVQRMHRHHENSKLHRRPLPGRQ